MRIKILKTAQYNPQHAVKITQIYINRTVKTLLKPEYRLYTQKSVKNAKTRNLVKIPITSIKLKICRKILYLVKTMPKYENLE